MPPATPPGSSEPRCFLAPPASVNTPMGLQLLALGGVGRRCPSKLCRGVLCLAVVVEPLHHLPNQSRKMTSTLVQRNGKYILCTSLHLFFISYRLVKSWDILSLLVRLSELHILLYLFIHSSTLQYSLFVMLQ
jgi:hypothetical protein